jgi:hypothetical protein
MSTNQSFQPRTTALPRRRSGALRAALAGLVALRVLGSAPAAHAEEPAPAIPPPTSAAPQPSWDERYDLAYAALATGKLREAAARFHDLARTARSERERVLAHELARLATEYAEREVPWPSGIAPVRPPAKPPAPSLQLRSPDEMTLLYATSFLYGVGSGVWFLLETQPDSAITATLPFAALTAAPVIAVATIDGIKPLPRGVPHAISAGVYLGLGESIFAVGRQQARAARLQDTYPNSDARFSPETVAAVLWTGATLGGVLGGALGAGLETTPGRVSFTASMTIWSGVLTGLTAGALLPDDDRRRERAFTVGEVGYNAGLAGGLHFAGRVSPSVARVRIGDLAAMAGGLVTTGTYLGFAKNVDLRLAEGLAAGGLATGLAAGWLLTTGMDGESAAPKATLSHASFEPRIVPVPAGAGLGVGGMF